MARWLVTRPRADAEILAAKLADMGHDAVVSPVIAVVPQPFSPIKWSRYHAVIFTSANAVAHGGKFPASARSLPVFAVGDKTAAAARAAGFLSVSSAGGDVGDLIRHLTGRPGVSACRYIHVCGQDTKGDLGGPLKAAGAGFAAVAVYQVQPVAALTEEASRELHAATLDGAIFLSPKTARIFAGLAREANIGPFGSAFVFAVISDATAHELRDLGGRVMVAERPDLGCVLALLH